jgi:2-keto-4-pentenoate hydratase/2-oxohepta-3-ene-1,7-dioic acid hydratase in catechol pathway
MPGDLIYTGTPGSTRKLSPGDVVEVEIEGIGILRNPVTAG